MRLTVLLLLLLGAVKLGEGRGRIDLLAQLTNRRAGASLLGRIRPSRPASAREQARALQQGSDVNQLASSANPPPTKLNQTPRPARQSLLERARSRPRRPFLPTKPTRAPFTPRRPSPRQSAPRVSNRRPLAAATSSLENRLQGGECDALRTENDLLKQLISSVTSQKPRCHLSHTFSFDPQPVAQVALSIMSKSHAYLFPKSNFTVCVGHIGRCFGGYSGGLPTCPIILRPPPSCPRSPSPNSLPFSWC